MKKKLLFNLITLTLTSFLLILTIYSWYVSNREVTANGISGHTVEPTPIVQNVIIHNFSAKNNNVYTLDENPTMDDTKFVMEYNPNATLDSNIKPSLKLFELQLITTGVNLEQINIQTTISKFIGYGNDHNWVSQAELNSGLSLSSVLKFKVLYTSQVEFIDNNTKIRFNNFDTETFDNYTYDKYIFDDSTGLIDSNYKKLLKANQTNITKIFILVDFNDDYIDRLFSLNIGNSIMEDVLYDDEKNLTFKCDFKFLVIGKEVE